MVRRRDGHIIVHKEAHVRLGAWVFGAGYRQYPRVWFSLSYGVFGADRMHSDWAAQGPLSAAGSI